MLKKPTWTHEQAVALCRLIEPLCPPFGCHVAPTGGALYKDGERKDCDLLFYRIRQEPIVDKGGLFAALEAALGLCVVSGFGWCHKALLDGRSVDMFFPEDIGEEYTCSPEAVIEAFTEGFR